MSEQGGRRMRRPPWAAPADPEVLRVRAFSHIRRREWEKAVQCLNETLREPEDQPINEDFVPNKQSLVLRGRIKLILNEKEAALSDALEAISGLSKTDSVYGKALLLRADALYQMGRFEHSLIFYHRGNRLKEGHDDDFRVGIHKSSDSIMNCLKSVKPKIKIDICVQDTSRMCDHQTTSLSSFVFPKEALQKKQPRSLEKEKRKRTDKVTFCALTSKPFQQDVVELKDIVRRLKNEDMRYRAGRTKTEPLATDVLNYVRERNTLWMKQESNRKTNNARGNLEFDRNNLPFLEQTK